MIKMRPLLNKDGFFSSETEQFLSPMEPKAGEEVEIRFRTYQNNVDEVCLMHKDVAVRMEFDERLDGFDYYKTTVIAPEEAFTYCFKILQGETVCYYDKLGLTQVWPVRKPFLFIPGFSTPDWAKGAVMYQIFVDRFANGDPDNDVVDHEYNYIGSHVRRISDWNKGPESMDVRNFYGGDLQGILNHLDYLSELGVEVLYLNPIFVSPSNHKYDTQDYDFIDPHFGKILQDAEGVLTDGDPDNRHADKYRKRITDPANLQAGNELFIHLVEEAHKRGMRVILDGVFNHCGSFNKWMDRERIYEGQAGYEPGAYVSEYSPYRDYFGFSADGKWPYNTDYEGWYGHDTLPKLNYEGSEKLKQDILRIAAKWVSAPYHADGWRLDVAADLGHSPEYNHKFWQDFRREVKKANPEAIILAEHYGSPKPWLSGDKWDTVMNYDAFMEPVSWFFTGMEKHSDAYQQELLRNSSCFIDGIQNQMTEYPAPSLLTSMNQLDNHDHSRFLTRTNHTVGRLQHLGASAAEEGIQKQVLRMAVVFQMTWPGAPTLYYGDEAGVCGFTDPDNRRTFPWGKEDQELTAFYRSAIALHRRYEVFRTGAVRFLFNDYGVIAYGRFDAKEQMIILINTREDPADGEVKLWPAGIPYQGTVLLKEVFRTDREGFSTEERDVPIKSGRMKFHIEAESSAVFVRKK